MSCPLTELQAFFAEINDKANQLFLKN